MTETHKHYDADGTLTGTTVVTRESEWDDEQRQIMLDHLDYVRKTARCGHHPSTGMDSTVGRRVEHERIECLDCTAIRVAREAWHKSHAKGDDKGPCEICADEVFGIDGYVPLD